MKRFHKILVCCLLGMMYTTAALAKTIMFVPADDRPVSSGYVADTIRAAQYEALVPPAELLAGRSRPGDPDRLWQWVMENAPRADAMVLSVDTLVYGGLVDSRTHDMSSNMLEWRLRRFNQLREEHPNMRVYAFSTIMRSPHASAGGMEPPYYEAFGPGIFQLTALRDKAEVAGLTAEEQKTQRRLEATVPKAYLADWLSRREKNLAINAKLIEYTRAGVFDYLIIGRDDTSPFSQSHRESRLLATKAADLPASKYRSFPGADQLGMVLVARASNDLTRKIPVVDVKYAMGAGAASIPSYEDQPIGNTIVDHILAAGGIVMNNARQPDLILAVNTPLDGHTQEAESFNNLPISSEGMRQFGAMIEQASGKGARVAVADIAFANGADNSLMSELNRRGLLDKLASYSGWNTASNTLGYAIGQGMLAVRTPDADRKRLLAVRYLDDWAYQANIRKELYNEIIFPRGGNLQFLDGLEPELTASLQQKTVAFVRQNLWFDPDTVRVTFPWNRMFEIQAEVTQYRFE